jgi:hypothetical protein
MRPGSASGVQLPNGVLKKLADAMTTPAGGGAGQIPAGFTYLGQFIDHDLTFDKTGLMEAADVSPAEIALSRSPTRASPMSE